DPQAADTDVSTLILLFNSNSFTGDTYYFDNLDSYQVDNGPVGNTPPTVAITNPSNGATFTEGTSISIVASASDSDGPVSQVEFFANGNSLGVDLTSPYAINWTVPLGTNSLTAV